jgi:hypothetical protein
MRSRIHHEVSHELVRGVLKYHTYLKAKINYRDSDKNLV